MAYFYSVIFVPKITGIGQLFLTLSLVSVENPEIASLHLKMLHAVLSKNTKHVLKYQLVLNHHSLSKWLTMCTIHDLGREHMLPSCLMFSKSVTVLVAVSKMRVVLHQACTPCLKKTSHIWLAIILTCVIITTIFGRNVTNTHIHFTALFPGPPGWAGAGRELLDFMVQGKINRGRHTDHPAGRHSIRTNQCPPPPSHFLQAGCPSCRPTNSVKALKAKRGTAAPNFWPVFVVPNGWMDQDVT